MVRTACGGSGGGLGTIGTSDTAARTRCTCMSHNACTAVSLWQRHRCNARARAHACMRTRAGGTRDTDLKTQEVPFWKPHRRPLLSAV